MGYFVEKLVMLTRRGGIPSEVAYVSFLAYFTLDLDLDHAEQSEDFSR